MTKKNKIIAYCILAALLLLLIFTAPFVIHMNTPGGSREAGLGMLGIIGVAVFFSLLIAFYGVPNYYHNKKIWPLLVIIVLALVALMFAHSAIRPEHMKGMGPPPGLPQHTMGPHSPPFPFPIIAIIFVLPASFSMLMLWSDTIRLKDQAENAQLKSELNFLKNQLSPHFLFNSLNTIYALSQKKPEESGKATLKLSRLLRFLVYDTQKEKTIALKDEVDFLDNYISLSQLRLNENTQVMFRHSVENPEFQIPPLILLVFVENCFKHGITSTRDTTIEIILKQEDDSLNFSTKNQIVQQSESTEQNGNVGLVNVKRRLDLNYSPEEYQFEHFTENDEFIVQLKLSAL